MQRNTNASLNLQAARFKEALPGHSPEPKRRALRASVQVKPGGRTRLLALVRSFALVGSIEPTNATIFISLVNPNSHLESGLCCRHLTATLFAATTAVFAVVIALCHRRCCRFSSPLSLQSLVFATVAIAVAPLAFGQVNSSAHFYC
ncbi:hypothetical protein BHE74_00023388 [Ensete ventricosum]|uniref:Uncharacterized protein n=1 Tax=Ensete ventricosum TaxID=4639 RepID=A0A426XZG4_ENSVE|nr:hypothetical protein B296_00031722 [Ensete ventricosum]RWW69034.1 hypothetical protein BHE74_00023388 [Ensete ventricosum]